MHFKELDIIPTILRAVEEEGYHTPTPIQIQAIPIVLKGTDLLACAQTGTGKTAAFAIPILQILSSKAPSERSGYIKSLILTPTRELAIQIDESLKAYGRYTDLKTTVIYGGVNQNSQTLLLKKGVDILVATPGRLLDLIDQGYVHLSKVEIFVLDEADRMLDMGFIHDVKKVLKILPKQKQTLLFSATMPDEIVSLSKNILIHPVKVEVTPSATTVNSILQNVYFVDKGNKNALLMDILNTHKVKTALVFTRTKHGADKVVRVLQKNHIKAEAIHGNKTQNARQKALTNFKNQSTRVLVATDIAARGIDIDDLEFVINYELPNIPETYVHRIGRTGRAGAKGTAISFCDAIEKELLRDIEKLIGIKIPLSSHNSFPMQEHNVTEILEKRAAATSQAQLSRRPRAHNERRNTKRTPASHNKTKSLK
ncbi:MAG: DEAD/DEAH box helicase [Bacteroidota bacterium]|nr:DEAD/DEAH box helicase [Bacteroidota bacterium]